MAQRTQSPDAIIVGAGIIGLSIAWQACRRGLAVTVLERGEAGRGTSHVAAGMLAPVAEAEFGEAGQRLLELGLRSADMWPAFAAELQAAAGLEVGLMRTGTLLVARDEDEARELDRQAAFRDPLGLATSRLRPSRARALEPTIRLALEASEDHSVAPRMVLAALRRACLDAGADLRERAPVARLRLDAAGGRLAGVELQGADRGGRLLAAPRVVIAAGAW